MSSKLNFHAALWYISILSPSPTFLPLPPSSTNLTELFKTVHLLAALSPTDLSGGELLRSARALIQLQLLGC